MNIKRLASKIWTLVNSNNTSIRDLEELLENEVKPVVVAVPEEADLFITEIDSPARSWGRGFNECRRQVLEMNAAPAVDEISNINIDRSELITLVDLVLGETSNPDTYRRARQILEKAGR